MTATPQDVLREAARILMRDGWTQGEMGPLAGPNCGAGAMARAAGCHIAQTDRTIQTAQNYWRARSVFEGFIEAPTAQWNDAPERTAEDVILALKRAAEES